MFKCKWLFIVLLGFHFSNAQTQKPATTALAIDTTKKMPPVKPPEVKPGPKPYKEVITDKAKTDDGFFTVHKVDDKYFFEIPDSLMNREWMTVVRISKTANGIGYGGEESNSQLLRWEKGADHKLFLRVVSYINVATENNPINKAVKASNVEPIIASFDIKALSKDSSGVIIDVTDFIKSDNPVFGLQPGFKRTFGLVAMMPDRSFINYIKSFTKNTELRTTKTFNTAPVANPSLRIPDATNVGIVTLELNTSLIWLPKTPMKRRFDDERVGYFRSSYTNYGTDAQKVSAEVFINRWRLEPKKEDIEKMKRGELVEPANPIVYYIDPATPVKWRKYLKLGVEDWQKAFEKAGFKNAILAKDFPENDSSLSLEDIRVSMIHYFASDIPNAYGPQTVDPRSGEVLQVHIGWYHNVMQLLRDWYLVQAAPNDPRARKPKFDDELMGDLIRFVSSHEVGHTLGLLHNFGSSSTVPVENLRNKAWVEANGHTPSIMDYARFNYVAQPEDNISSKGIYPRIGVYDEWAIQFGYKPVFDKDEYEESSIIKDWVKQSTKDKRLLYLLQRPPANPFFPDPRAQNEDVGDNAMLAGEYGIKNLKRIVPQLDKWMVEPGKNFEEVDEIYDAVREQYKRYLNHVLANIAGIYETPRTSDQEGGVVFIPVPKKTQLEAMAFLRKHVFTTPDWLINFPIQKLFNQDQVVDELRAFQDNLMSGYLNNARFARFIDNTAMLGEQTYTLSEFITDLRKAVWSDLYARKSPDWYKRNFQKIYIERIASIIENPAKVVFPPGLNVDRPRRYFSKYFGGQMDIAKSDVLSILKGSLRTLKRDINAALPSIINSLEKDHYQDIIDRIDNALDNSKK